MQEPSKDTTMEKLQQIQQTLGEIDGRVPAALRVTLRIGYHLSPAPADIASFCRLPTAAAEDVATVTSADEELISTAALRLRYGSCYVPLHDHDAHFGRADAGVLGVADGVGAFARGLMASALAAVEPAVCPYALLETAYTRAAASGAPGASTAVIVSLAGTALRWAYVGDSGFAVLRGGRVVCRSKPQQRSLNSSLRLSGRPDDSDGVAVARAGQVAARDRDVVVVGTDGLFDNVRDEQLEQVVRMGTRLGFSAKNMADMAAGVAYEASRRTLMGKADDITVLVAFLVQPATWAAGVAAAISDHPASARSHNVLTSSVTVRNRRPRHWLPTEGILASRWAAAGPDCTKEPRSPRDGSGHGRRGRGRRRAGRRWDGRMDGILKATEPAVVGVDELANPR
ncbi:hypothetical protein C2845_PM10G00710 [Panicum miliaceum]|uniref:Protein phosphatase n=1 Tax=Panicum miliaceum TaxID=4540 RepID=A0A3L6PFD7_PANMI|nr:hypothetical protein C2845_PM10G00710 [Panicum miliaceum]